MGPLNESLAYAAIVRMAQSIKAHTTLDAARAEDSISTTVGRDYLHLVPAAIDEAFGPRWWAVHFGVEPDRARLDDIINPVEFLGGAKDVGVFQVPGGPVFHIDGDSFTAWGEAFVEGRRDAAHVLVFVRVHRVEVKAAREMGRDFWRETCAALRESLEISVFPGSGLRVSDYAVVTDREDWSRDVKIVGRWA